MQLSFDFYKIIAFAFLRDIVSPQVNLKKKEKETRLPVDPSHLENFVVFFFPFSLHCQLQTHQNIMHHHLDESHQGQFGLSDQKQTTAVTVLHPNAGEDNTMDNTHPSIFTNYNAVEQCSQSLSRTSWTDSF